MTNDNLTSHPTPAPTKELSTAQKVGVVSLGVILYLALKTGSRIISIFVFSFGLYVGSFFGTLWAFIFGFVAVFVFWRVVRVWLLKKLKPQNDG